MKTILLVEDSLHLCALYQEELGEIGYHTLSAGSGREALEQMTRHHLDLVVLDINMPGMDGIEVLEHMIEAWPHLPVIINTGFDSYKHSFRFWSVAAFVLKSSDLTELKFQVQRVLSPQEPDLLLLPRTDGKA